MKTPMLTIRLSAPLHEAVKELAHSERMSINSLACKMLSEAVSHNHNAAEVYAIQSKVKRSA